MDTDVYKYIATGLYSPYRSIIIYSNKHYIMIMKLKNLFKEVKGQFGLSQMVPVVITFVIIAVAAVLGLQLLGDQQADFASGSAEYNATQDAIDGVSEFPQKLPMIAGVLVLVLIIGILIAAFSRLR